MRLFLDLSQTSTKSNKEKKINLKFAVKLIIWQMVFTQKCFFQNSKFFVI